MFFPVLVDDSLASDAVVMASNSAGGTIQTYPWDGTSLGTKITDPASLPGTEANGCTWNPYNTAVVVALTGTPYVAGYPWSAGYGTKYSNPSVLPASKAWGVDISRTGGAVCLAHDLGVCTSAYAFSPVTGYGAKYSDPSSGLANNAHAVDFGTNLVAFAHQSSPFVSVYDWSDASGFGTKYSNPSTLPTDDGWAVAFNRRTEAIAMGQVNTPFYCVYPWSGGFGAKYSLTTTGLNWGRGVRFTPTDGAIVFAYPSTSPFMKARSFSVGGGIGAAYSDPSTVPTVSCWSVGITASGNAISIGKNAGGGPPTEAAFWVFPWSDSTGWGTKITDPIPLMTGAGWGTAFNGRS